MTEMHVRLPERYRNDEREGAGNDGPSLGADLRLRRRVLLWNCAATENDPQRTAFLTLARECARLAHPAFLRVFDLAVTPEQVTVVLEAPEGAALAGPAYLPPSQPGQMAAKIVLQVGMALEAGALGGLRPWRLPLGHLYVDGVDSVRVDPLGLYWSAEDQAAPPGMVALLCELLAALWTEAGDAETPARSDALRFFLVRWRRLGPQCPDHLLPDFLSELRTHAAGAPGGQGRRAAGAAAPEEVTRVLPSVRPAAPQVRRWAPVAAAGAAAAVLLAGVAAMSDATAPPPDAAAPAPAAPSPTNTAPLTNGATLSLAAPQDSPVRVSVDGAIAFDGVLKAGESRSWHGSQRVQVATTAGKTLLVVVNGHALGPLSAAVGHPEWNAVDWGWHAGWRP